MTKQKETTEKDGQADTSGEQNPVVRMKTVSVLINRDASTSVSATVFEYELPVLVAIHGEEQVAETGEEDEIEVPEFTATEGFYALLRKYRQHDEAVRSVYPDARALARLSDLRFDPNDALDAKGRGSLQIDHRKAA